MTAKTLRCPRCNRAVFYVRALGQRGDVALDPGPLRRMVLRYDDTGPYASGLEYCVEADTFTRHDETCTGEAR